MCFAFHRYFIQILIILLDCFNRLRHRIFSGTEGGQDDYLSSLKEISGYRYDIVKKGIPLLKSNFKAPNYFFFT